MSIAAISLIIFSTTIAQSPFGISQKEEDKRIVLNSESEVEIQVNLPKNKDESDVIKSAFDDFKNNFRISSEGILSQNKEDFSVDEVKNGYDYFLIYVHKTSPRITKLERDKCGYCAGTGAKSVELVNPNSTTLSLSSVRVGCKNCKGGLVYNKIHYVLKISEKFVPVSLGSPGQQAFLSVKEKAEGGDLDAKLKIAEWTLTGTKHVPKDPLKAERDLRMLLIKGEIKAIELYSRAIAELKGRGADGDIVYEAFFFSNPNNTQLLSIKDANSTRLRTLKILKGFIVNLILEKKLTQEHFTLRGLESGILKKVGAIETNNKEDLINLASLHLELRDENIPKNLLDKLFHESSKLDLECLMLLAEVAYKERSSGFTKQGAFTLLKLSQEINGSIALPRWATELDESNLVDKKTVDLFLEEFRPQIKTQKTTEFFLKAAATCK